MSDRTALQVIVLSCPLERVRAVLAVLAKHGLREFGGAEDVVVLREEYLALEMPIGTAEHLATELVAAAPEVAFLTWDDPRYEWLGTVFAYVPGVGQFTGPCDSQGIPLWTTDQVLGLLGPGKVLDADGELQMGVAVFARIQELLNRDGTTIGPT